MRSRILIVSDFNSRDRAHFALSSEFCRIVAECDDADIVAPGIDNYLERRLGRILPEHDSHNVQRDFNRLVNAARKRFGLRNAATIERVSVDQTYDVLFFVGWSPQSLVELSRIRNWRKQCKIAVAYLFELWSSTLEQDRAYLKLLDQFDYVFLLHSACMPQLYSYTRARCFSLVTGVDCLISAPGLSPAERTIDVYSYGNRSANIHRQLLQLTETRNFFYIYDSLSSTDSRVANWREHRLLLANMIRRSRYFIAFSPATLNNSKTSKMAGEQVVPSRFFEGAAGGAVILGTAPKSKDFDECFDWPDAVIEVPPDTGEIAAVIDELDAQPERIERVRRANAINCLRRHDWVYRWERILNTIGVEPRPQLRARKARLEQMAAEAQPYGSGTSAGFSPSPRGAPAAKQPALTS